MNKIRIIARVVAKPGKEDELRRILAELVPPSRAEGGCAFYDLYESQEPGQFYFDELWESQEALGLHIASPHFQNAEGAMKEVLDGSQEANFLRPIDVES